MLPDRINVLQYIKIHQNLYNNLLYNYNLGMNILSGDPEYYQGQDIKILYQNIIVKVLWLVIIKMILLKTYLLIL